MKNFLPLVLCPLASCALPTLGVEARYGPVNVDGDVGLSAGNVTANNSVDDAGIDDDDGAPSLRGDFKWGLPHLSVTLQQSTHDGSGRLGADLSSGGVTIPAGTQVDTDMDLGLHTAYLTFDLMPGDWELGLGVGVVAFDLDLKAGDGMGNSVSTDELVPIPVIAGRAGISLLRFDFEALAGFMDWSAGSDDVTFLDFDVNGKFRLLGEGDHTTGWVVAGLRYTDIDAEYEDGSDDVAVDMQFTGPYLGLRFVF